jgi:hypothetical protein
VWLTAGELIFCVLLSTFGVAYAGAVDVFGLSCVADSVRSKFRVVRSVANGVPSRLSIVFLVSLLVCGNFLAVLSCYS